jgi:ribosomal protein L11 methyltransferase
MLDVDAEAAEALSDALLDAGAYSVSLDDVEAPRCRLNALVGLDANADALLARATAMAQLPATPHFRVARIEDADWVRRSQAQFAPVRIGERLWVGPSWQEPPPRIEAVVRLDPGLAFGTGSHPSTRLALRFLEQHVRGGERVLDYGCGSGILAIAAAKLGAAQVDAVDLDEEAVQTAAANASANEVPVRTAAPDEIVPALYDIVVCNILAQPLIVLAPLLIARTASHGRIALSGILEDQAAEVADAYAAFFDVGSARTEEGWALIEGLRR